MNFRKGEACATPRHREIIVSEMLYPLKRILMKMNSQKPIISTI